MGKIEFWDLSGVSDQHLLRDLGEFLANGARVEAKVVAHLAEVEERRLHLRAAWSSLFDYCVRRLQLSESEAFHRITAARLARKFPVIFGLLATRSIHLSALRVLRDHLTRENHRELLAAAAGKSKKEVEALVAALAPRPDVAPLIRKLPTTRRTQPALSDAVLATTLADAGSAPIAATANPRWRPPSLEASPSDGAIPTVGLADQPETGSSSAVPIATPANQSDSARGDVGDPSAHAPGLAGAAPAARLSAGTQAIAPLSSTRYLLRLSVSREVTDKLERARDLMSHANPRGELAAVIERALDLLLEELGKQRFAQTKRPRTAHSAAIEPSPQRAELGEAGSQSTADRESARLDGDGPRELESAPESASNRAEAIVREARHAPRARVTLDDAPGCEQQGREQIPNDVRRAVAKRDGFQCTYLDDEGRRCPSRAFLQLHHEQAHALGGPSTLENLRLLCASHNRLLAEQDFGRSHQDWVIRRKTQPRSDGRNFPRS